MMRLLSVVFIVFVCGLPDVRGWTEYDVNALSNSGEWWIIYCCDNYGRSVETWCGSWNGWIKDCCDTCFWNYGSSAWMSECLETLSGSRWANRRKADYHCRRVKYDGPFYCDWDRKKRSATSNQTIVPPTVSGIKKDIIPTNFKTRTWMSGKNRKPPTEPESKYTITWMSGIKKKWNKKGKKTITWEPEVPSERPAFNQTITDAAFNQTIIKNQRNGYSCDTSLTVDMYPCYRRVKTRSQMRRMQCPCCLLPSKRRQICGYSRCPC